VNVLLNWLKVLGAGLHILFLMSDVIFFWLYNQIVFSNFCPIVSRILSEKCVSIVKDIFVRFKIELFGSRILVPMLVLRCLYKNFDILWTEHA
jgi:hypothetical protein